MHFSSKMPGMQPLPVPTFSLYGEPVEPGREMLHIEDIQSRSRVRRWEIDTHVHQGLYQIVWIARGWATATLDEHRLQVPAMSAVVVPPGVVHGFRFAPETAGFVLTISPRFLLDGDFQETGDAFRQLFSAAGIVHFDAGCAPGDAPDDASGNATEEATEEACAAHRMQRLFAALMDEFRAPAAPGATNSPVPTWLARAVVWRLARARQQAAQAGHPHERAWRHQAMFARFMLLVESHFMDHWPLERYASRLGMSTTRLNRLVRAEAGRSALQCIHDRLTREACRRLAYVAAPASRLAVDLGFDDPAYFNRFFKRQTGMTPLRWRVAHRQAATAPA